MREWTFRADRSQCDTKRALRDAVREMFPGDEGIPLIVTVSWEEDLVFVGVYGLDPEEHIVKYLSEEKGIESPDVVWESGFLVESGFDNDESTFTKWYSYGEEHLPAILAWKERYLISLPPLRSVVVY